MAAQQNDQEAQQNDREAQDSAPTTVFAEIFPLVTEEGLVIGSASRAQCHAGSFLLHPVVHLHVFRSDGSLYLQKRSLSKDIQPGKWDTSVGGHVDWSDVDVSATGIGNNEIATLGETSSQHCYWPLKQAVEKALRREAREELGITDFEPIFALSYPFRSDREYELVHTYYTRYDGPIQPDPVEIGEGRYWTSEEIQAAIGTGVFTPNFEQEYPQLAKNIRDRKQ